jgi:hypothetical protein
MFNGRVLVIHVLLLPALFLQRIYKLPSVETIFYKVICLQTTSDENFISQVNLAEQLKISAEILIVAFMNATLFIFSLNFPPIFFF